MEDVEDGGALAAADHRRSVKALARKTDILETRRAMSSSQLDVPANLQPTRAAREAWRWGFPLALGLAVILRLGFSYVSRGNYDLESWEVAAKLVDEGKNVYANTVRYNSGPWWSLIVWVLWRVSHLLPIHNSFHVSIVGFLTLVDVSIALFIRRRFSSLAAAIFLLCPVTIVLTAVHSQFDELAVLLGLLAWDQLTRGSRPSCWVRAGLLMGLSLSCKHLMLFFPIWAVMDRSLGSWRNRLGFAAIAYATFAACFIPWAIDPQGRAGIVQNVFLYRSLSANGITPMLVSLIFPDGALAGLVNEQWAGWFLQRKLPTLVWLGCLMIIGWITSKRRPADLIYLYLLAFVGLSPAMADQYLAIPVVACAIAYRWWPSWAYFAVAFIHLCYSGANLGPPLTAIFPGIFGYEVTLYWQAQVCLVALVAALLYWPDRAIHSDGQVETQLVGR